MASWNLELVERSFADAAVDPTRWIAALEVLTKQTGSFGTVLLPVSGGGPIPSIPYTETMGESADVYFRDGWHQRDERYRGVSLLLERGVVDDLDVLDPDEIQRHPYYQEFLAPLGLQWFAGVKIASETDVWCLSVQRRNEQGPFSDNEKHQLARLSHRLSSSAVLSRTLSTAAADGALDAFDMCRTAVVLINRRGEVFRANQSAEHLLVGDVRISRGKLTARDERATSTLDRTLHDLIWRREGSALAAPVLLPRQGQRPLLAYPVKLSKLTSNALADCHCAVVLVDPDKRGRPLEATLQASYRLTDAEARLAARLAAGTSLATAASELGIAKETSRSQLKNVFMKTGTHRQAELVALLAPLVSRSE
jgi:DNA-binding CsgD family transcriptional regulator